MFGYNNSFGEEPEVTEEESSLSSMQTPTTVTRQNKGGSFTPGEWLLQDSEQQPVIPDQECQKVETPRASPKGLPDDSPMWARKHLEETGNVNVIEDELIKPQLLKAPSRLKSFMSVERQREEADFNSGHQIVKNNQQLSISGGFSSYRGDDVQMRQLEQEAKHAEHLQRITYENRLTNLSTVLDEREEALRIKSADLSSLTADVEKLESQISHLKVENSELSDKLAVKQMELQYERRGLHECEAEKLSRIARQKQQDASRVTFVPVIGDCLPSTMSSGEMGHIVPAPCVLSQIPH